MTKFSKTLYILLMVFVVASFVYQLTAFRYSENQIDSLISEHVTQSSRLPSEVVSVSELAQKEESNVKVVMYQYIGTSGLETGVAVFTQLQNLPFYRVEDIEDSSGNMTYRSIIDTGTSQQLISIDGSEITISKIGTGSLLRMFGLMFFLTLVAFLSWTYFPKCRAKNSIL